MDRFGATVARVIGGLMLAVVCERGHMLSSNLEAHPAPPFCPTCGAVVLTACLACGAAIPGECYVSPRMASISPEAPPLPNFCEQCGAAFPWVDHQGRIWQLENLLPGDLDPATALSVREQLEALAGPALSDEDQRSAWKRPLGTTV
jgi:hypothetical protein